MICEETMRRGGMGEIIASCLSENGTDTRVRVLAIDDFVPHGDTDSLLRMLGLDKESIASAVRKMIR